MQRRRKKTRNKRNKRKREGENRTISCRGRTGNFSILNQESPGVGHIITGLWGVNLAEGQRDIWRDQLAVFNSGGNLMGRHIGETLADKPWSVQQELLAVNHGLSGHL